MRRRTANTSRRSAPRPSLAPAEYERLDADSALIVEETVATLLGHARQAQRELRACEDHRAIRRAIGLLHESTTAYVSLLDVARYVGLSPTHLARTFRRHMGLSVGSYARRLRAVRALEHMRRYPSWPLLRVAAEAGFSDHPHCTRVFSRVFGMSPSRLRRSAAEW